MVLKVTGKGDFNLLRKFKEGDFESYELYLGIYDDKVIEKKILTFPLNIKISSIHNSACIDVEGRRHPFDIAASGKIGEASLSSLKKTINLAKKLGSSVIVIHGATYNAFNESKEEAMQRVANRVLPLYREGINLCFENDVLWHNLYYDRRALLTQESDFKLLNHLLGGRLKITLDFEHLNLSFLFLEFLKSLGGEIPFMNQFSAISQKPFEISSQKFIKENFDQLQTSFKDYLSSFFKRFNEKIEHIHITGSDCCNYIFNPHTALPLVGEHLPLSFTNEGVSDRMDYKLISSLLYSLPEEKEINVVLEIWRTEPEAFLSASIESRDFLENILRKEQKMDGENMKTIYLENKPVKNFGEPYVIAEIGSNHNGDLELAKKHIDAAIECGADSVKFQAFGVKLFSSVCYEDDDRREELIRSNPILGKYLTQTHKSSLKKEMTEHVASKEMLRSIKEYCDQKGITFFCTPLNREIANYLIDDLNMPFIKVASMDLNNLPFLDFLSKKGKPIILSTGMGNFQEILEAVNTILDAGNDQIILLHCVSLYPPKDEHVNLNNLDLLRKTFDFPIGFSDHTFGTSVPLAAVAKGACIIEKHFTLDKNLPGWDHKISANPQEMKVIVEDGKKIFRSLGSFKRVVTQDELDKKTLFGRSVVVNKDLPSGHVLRYEDLELKRPGIGIEPKYLKFMVGRTLKKNLRDDDLLKMGDLV
jgi:sialic acid synthase SpsE